MRGRDFLDKMELVSPIYVEGADRTPIIRPKQWPKFVVAAACLCLVAWGAWGLTGGFDRGPGYLAGPGASGAPVIGEQPSETPEISAQPSETPSQAPVVDDSEAMAAYGDVLDGKAGFTYILGPDETLEVGIANIKSIYNPELPDDYKLSIDFTVLDLDGDGGNEVVLWVDRNSAVGCSIVLHYQEGTVYGFLFYPRSLGDLKTDGAFWFSSSAADHGFGRLAFARPGCYTVDRTTYSKPEGDGWGNMLYVVDHQTATADEFDAAVSEFYDREEPAWYPLTEENLAALAMVEAGPEPRYNGIKNVVFEMEYPPFDRYDLTTAEVNKLISYLSAMDFSEYETTPFIPEGDGIICTITTADKNYELIFLKPYVIYDGIVYDLNTVEKLFAIVSHIAGSH